MQYILDPLNCGRPYTPALSCLHITMAWVGCMKWYTIGKFKPNVIHVELFSLNKRLFTPWKDAYSMERVIYLSWIIYLTVFVVVMWLQLNKSFIPWKGYYFSSDTSEYFPTARYHKDDHIVTRSQLPDHSRDTRPSSSERLSQFTTGNTQ